MNKELYQDYINGLSISGLADKYKVSKMRVYKIITEYSKEQGKMFEVIKNKNVRISWIKSYSCAKSYNNGLPLKEQLTEEEFNTLKEMLR